MKRPIGAPGSPFGDANYMTRATCEPQKAEEPWMHQGSPAFELYEPQNAEKP